MSRDALYTDYATRILDSLQAWPKDQPEMEKFLQLVTVCVEKCIKNKRMSKFALSTPVWLAYAKAYKQRYATEPSVSPKCYALCQQLIDSVGSQVAVELAAYYVNVKDPWFEKSYHTLAALMANQNYQGVLVRMRKDKEREERCR